MYPQLKLLSLPTAAGDVTTQAQFEESHQTRAYAMTGYTDGDLHTFHLMNEAKKAKEKEIEKRHQEHDGMTSSVGAAKSSLVQAAKPSGVQKNIRAAKTTASVIKDPAKVMDEARKAEKIRSQEEDRIAEEKRQDTLRKKREKYARQKEAQQAWKTKESEVQTAKRLALTNLPTPTSTQAASPAGIRRTFSSATASPPPQRSVFIVSQSRGSRAGTPVRSLSGSSQDTTTGKLDEKTRAREAHEKQVREEAAKKAQRNEQARRDSVAESLLALSRGQHGAPIGPAKGNLENVMKANTSASRVQKSVANSATKPAKEVASPSRDR